MTETERLRLLAESQLLDSASEETFDRFTKVASLILNAPVSLVSLVDRDRQYFKSYHGLPGPWAAQHETPLSHSFCQYVVASHQPLIVEDARKKEYLKCNPAIPELGVIAYLGFPLVIEEQVLGSFCVIDHKPRAWSEQEIHIVGELAHFVATEISLRIEEAERKKAEKQLRASEERFRTLANQAPIMIWQTDIHGNATFHNTTWSIFTGLPEQEGLDMKWGEAIHPDDRERAVAVWKQAVAEHLPYDNEFRLYRADGVYREIVSHGSLYNDQSGTPLGYIGTLMDVTEQKEIERQRESSLNMITHELKAPLSSMQANVQLAQRHLKALLNNTDTPGSREQNILAQVIDMLTRGMISLQDQARLIDDLLDLSRFQGEKLEFHLAPCDLMSLVRQEVQNKQAAQSERAIVPVFPKQDQLMVFADEQRTRQVVSNYLINACKYAPPEKQITVGISSDETCARVWVKDHGSGLTKEQQEHIWERFYQTHETPSYAKETPGLGLGLYICQMLIHGQRGEVGVESTRGEGATFWFTLPLLQH